MKVNKILFAFVRVGLTVILLLLLIYAAVRFGSVGYDFGYRVFTESPMSEEPGTDILVQVKDDMSGRELGQMLEEKGLVRDGDLFYLQLSLSVYRKKIQPGVYTLNTSMDAKQMMMIMAAAEEETETEEIDEQVPQVSDEVGGEEVAGEEDLPVPEEEGVEE